jgi:hypothetical protein
MKKRESMMEPEDKSDDLIIRLGTPADLDEVMKAAVEAIAEIGLVEPDPERLLQDVWPALNQDRGLIGIICKPDGKAEGGVLLRVGKMWYSNQDVLEERVIFIPPEFRTAKGGRATRLCEFSKKAAEDLGIPLLIGVMSSVRTEAKVRMYERQFGKPTGAVFLYNATPFVRGN